MHAACKQNRCDEKLATLSISVSDLTEEMPAFIQVCLTFTLLESTISQDCTQTARQATYYAFSAAWNNAFVEQLKHRHSKAIQSKL